MKKLALIVLIAGVLIGFASCKKTETPTPMAAAQASPAPVVQSPTIDVEFFVSANEYEIRSPLEYPNGSPMFKDLTNTFHSLVGNDACVATGKKLTIKYSVSDTTLFSFWFYNDATPTATIMGSGSFKITKTGDVIQSYGHVPGSSLVSYFATCKKAMVLK